MLNERRNGRSFMGEVGSGLTIGFIARFARKTGTLPDFETKWLSKVNYMEFQKIIPISGSLRWASLG